MSPPSANGTGTALDKAALGARIVMLTLRYEWETRRKPLPEIISEASATGHRATSSVGERRIARAITGISDRLLPWSPRCIIRALVLYRLLVERGLEPALVIGLASHPRTKDAHAWVEVDGEDAGPAPGRAGHQEMARFGVAAP